MFIVTNSFVVIVLSSFSLPLTEEVRVGRRQRTISTCVMYCFKYEKEPSVFFKVVVAYENLKTKEKALWYFTKVVAVAYEGFSSQCLIK